MEDDDEDVGTVQRVQDSTGKVLVLLEKFTARAIRCAQKHARTASASRCANRLAGPAAIACAVT